MSGPGSGCAQEGKDVALQRGHWSVMQSVTGRGEGLPHLHPLSPARPQHSVFGNGEGLKGEAQIGLFCAPLKASMPGLTELSLWKS